MVTAQQPWRSRARCAFTLLEVVLAMTIFMMMTLVFAAVFPITVQAAHYSNNYTQAALLAQHKIDQLRSAGINNLNYTNLNGLGIVDTNASATGPTYTFTSVDNLTSFFPAGTTGTIKISDYSTLSNVTNPPPTGNVYIATVTLTWPGLGSTTGSYTTSGMIVSMVHE